MGNVIIAEASPETMAYVAGYVTKKAYGNDTKRYNELGLPAPYCCMSRNPGLGYDYYQEHKEQMYKDDGLYFNGKKRPIPRYFDKMQETENPKRLWEVKEKRQSSAINALKVKMSNTDVTIEQQGKIKEKNLRERFSKARGILWIFLIKVSPVSVISIIPLKLFTLILLIVFMIIRMEFV